jgi:hypothetical protein
MASGLVVKHTQGKGDGVYAGRRFRRLEIVVPGFVLKTLNRNTTHASEIGIGKYVLHGGLMSKVNHSCDPNCGIRLNRKGAHDLIAMREINIGEEITYDYAMRNSKIEFFRRKCQCKSLRCRGKITGWDRLDDATRRRYAGFIAPHLLSVKNP